MKETEASNPLEQEKMQKLADIKQEIKNEDGPKKRGRKPGQKNKQVPSEEPGEVPPPEQLKAEAEFLLQLITTARNFAGIQTPLNQAHSQMFVISYIEIVKKYGSVATKYMPEIMFGASLALIGLDSYGALKKLALEEKAKKEEAKPE